jgi:hypothetical protein
MKRGRQEDHRRTERVGDLRIRLAAARDGPARQRLVPHGVEGDGVVLGVGREPLQIRVRSRLQQGRRSAQQVVDDDPRVHAWRDRRGETLLEVDLSREVRDRIRPHRCLRLFSSVFSSEARYDGTTIR